MLHFTARWCCDRHPGSQFDWHHFFAGCLLYQDPKTSNLYYGSADDPNQEEILLPLRKKWKVGVKVRATNQHKPLISRLLTWHAGMHSKDPLASVRPPLFILNDKAIKVLTRLHPSSVTQSEQVVDVLGKTQEWQDQWSILVFEVIWVYDQELADCHKEEVA